MLGQLWRVAKEQCRPATTDEKVGVEAVMGECKELVEEFKRNPHRAGYKDVSREPWPPEDPHAQDAGSPEGPAEEIYTPSLIGDDVELDAAESLVPTENGEHEDMARQDTGGITEPERELVPYEEQNPMPEPPEHPVQESAPREPEHMRHWRNYQRRSDQMDDLTRLRERQGVRPYWTWQGDSVPVLSEEDDLQSRLQFLAECVRPKREKDYWTVELEEKRLVRHHVQKRKARYYPMSENEEAQLRRATDGARTTVVEFSAQVQDRDGVENYVAHDTWVHATDRGRTEGRWWRGRTEFALRPDLSPEELRQVRAFAQEKRKGQDEVKVHLESPDDQKEWRAQDRAEWDKVVAKGAEVLSLEESIRVREELRNRGQEDRILPTKVARRYKPGDQPGEPAIKKSRLCIRGDLDPDALPR